jgi:CRP-like cAMP-binding protein
MNALTRTYEAGTVLFEENDPGSRMYVVTSGKVSVTRRLGDAEIVLATIGAGEFFGEMALLEQLPRTATATVAERAELLEIDEETFNAMLHDNSELAQRMLRRLSARLRDTDRRFQNALIENGVGRMLEVLRGLLRHGQPDEGHWLVVRPTFDIFAYAGIANTQRESVERRLERARLIERRKDDWRIANEVTLADFSEYLQLHQTYDPLIARELGELKASELHEDVLERLIKRVLVDGMANGEEDPASAQRVLGEYERYLSLKERFGPMTSGSTLATV